MNRRTFLRHSSILAAGVMLIPRLRAQSGAELASTANDRGSGLLEGMFDDGDLRLPAWGPYTKALAGVSHLPDLDRGVRFDLSVFPALYRRKQDVPTVTSDSGFYAWSADPNLRHYTLRHVLGEIERFYADITYAQCEAGVEVTARIVNGTALPQQVSLHFLASIAFPEAGPYRQPPLRAAEVKLPPGSVWIDGSHYAKLVCNEQSPQRHLPDNAELWGEVRADGYVNGVALGGEFGRAVGQRAVYALPKGFEPVNTMAVIRWRAKRGRSVRLRVTGAYTGEFDTVASGDFQLFHVHGGNRAAGFVLEPQGRAPVEIDGIALLTEGRAHELAVRVPELDYRPKLEHAGERTLLLNYAAIEGVYGLTWEGEDSEVREWLTDRIERDFPLYTHEHVKRVLDLGGQRHYANVFVRPIFLEPGATRELRAFVGHDRNAVDLRDRFRRFHGERRAVDVNPAPALPPHTPAGEAYAYGIERLAAVLATNVVYPVRRRGRFIRHYTPGRWWDSLYTWDSGFIGLGLLELAPARSVDNLAAYLAREDEDFAFVHHGSPVPVQIYQLQALWNRTRDRALLKRFFPMARRMHRFLVGRGDGSTTHTLGSGLIRTWDYFYNSGGWDDYPPQKFLRGTPLTANVTPVVNSAHAIRTARLLAGLGSLVEEPVTEFEQDVAELGEALQRWSWNPKSGWFSYVQHDASGQPAGPLLHQSGEDFNRGLDGIYPLVAGICTPAQRALFLQRLRDEKVFWSDCGLSTVDRSAPFFRDDGYWNGAVWMPHQWFFWKTMLDLGEADFAWQIAETALRTWEREVRATGCCFEHFIMKTGRGAGWHQFGGLSSPVLSWFSAYFRPGMLTGGFDCWVLGHAETSSEQRWRLRFTGDPHDKPVVIAVLARGAAAHATWDGHELAVRTRVPGTVEITLPSGAAEGELVIP